MNSINEKRTYFKPLVERVTLDSEISLALESPPAGPNEGLYITPDYLKTDPFKTKHA